MRSYDTVIIGGGIVGLSVAREILRRHPAERIAVVEKESALGAHASGRNSGVIHSGIYYPPQSLKARVCSAGASAMLRFCDERGLPVLRCGKVLVPASNEDDPQLDLLLERSRLNGVNAQIVGTAELKDLEPAAFSISGRALFVPGTSVVDPLLVLRTLAGELESAGVDFLPGSPARNIRPGELMAGEERLVFKKLINAAGLHADAIAKQCGVSDHYAILPFRGTYYELRPASGIQIRRLIYPVPDLRVPFLGIHFTLSPGGKVYIGPNAMPALGREHYRGAKGFSIADSVNVLTTMTPQYLFNRDGLRRHIHDELSRTSRFFFARAARKLVPAVRARDLKPSTKVGIRAQLFDQTRKELVMDFVIERGKNSVHVLNAVSPGFTSAFSFAERVADEWERAD